MIKFMTSIKLYGPKCDDNINKIILNSLNQYGIAISKKYDEILFIDNVHDNFKDQNINVFKNTFKINRHMTEFNENSINIIDSQNEHAISYLNNRNETTVTCGVSNKNSLMMESLTQYKAIISLQRNIKTSNELICPQGFKIELFNEIGIYPLLVTSAILLIAGIPSENGYTF